MGYISGVKSDKNKLSKEQRKLLADLVEGLPIMYCHCPPSVEFLNNMDKLGLEGVMQFMEDMVRLSKWNYMCGFEITYEKMLNTLDKLGDLDDIIQQLKID